MARMRISTCWLLAVAPLVWITLTLLAPLAAHLKWPVAPFFYAFFSPICHQSSARSLSLYAEPIAVCARCFGLYCGFWLGLVLLPLVPRLYTRLLKRPRLVLLFMIPMILDLLANNTHASRYFSGLIASFPVAIFVWVAAEQFGDSLRRFTRRKT
jgi:uncharacterized membrane protein